MEWLEWIWNMECTWIFYKSDPLLNLKYLIQYVSDKA